jgi:hypothetical protein
MPIGSHAFGFQQIIALEDAIGSHAFGFQQIIALEDAIGSHAFSLEALACVWPMTFLSGVHSSYRFTL